jgi:hypothetical protein
MVHHVVSFPAYESHEFSFTHPAVYQRGLDAQARACAGRAEPLARRARERGWRAEVSIDAGRGKIAESILRRAQGCGLIAMASRSGPVSTVLFGSVTRWVVRKAEAPVLVLGSRGPGRVGAEDGLPAASAGGIEGLAAERLRSCSCGRERLRVCACQRAACAQESTGWDRARAGAWRRRS